MSPRTTSNSHLPPLDGWRGISILLVLACHMLPLGPKRWALNAAAGDLGMTLFFALSGFLITLSLHRLHDTRVFFIRRLTRIVPAYLLVVSIALLIDHATPQQWLTYLLFRTNYSFNLLPGTQPLWSLCVEMHFYLAIGLLMALTRFRALRVLPLAFLTLTACRAMLIWGTTIETHVRLNELLAGAALAAWYVHPSFSDSAILRFIPQWAWLMALLLTSLPTTGSLQYLRPVIAIYGIGQTLAQRDGALTRLLSSRPLRYIATISYALYLFHSLTMLGWLGAGSTVVRYLKRPLCIALSLAAAHLSTHTIERHFNELGRKWAERVANGRSRSTHRSPLTLALFLPAKAAA